MKTEFFHNRLSIFWNQFLPIIEISLLFETTDEHRTGQAYAKSHVGVT